MLRHQTYLAVLQCAEVYFERIVIHKHRELGFTSFEV